MYGFFVENWNNLSAYYLSDGVIDWTADEFSYGGGKGFFKGDYSTSAAFFGDPKLLILLKTIG